MNRENANYRQENENLQGSLKQCNNAGDGAKAVPLAKLSSNEETVRQRGVGLTRAVIAQKSSQLPTKSTTEQRSTSAAKQRLKSPDEEGVEEGQIQKPVPDGGVGIVPNREQEIEANVQVIFHATLIFYRLSNQEAICKSRYPLH